MDRVMLRRRVAPWAICGGLALVAAPAFADVQIVLKKTFIAKFKSRALIEADDVRIHEAKKVKTIGKGSLDGDIHISAISQGDIGLPAVVEIMNAKGQPTAVAAAKAAKGGPPVTVKGVWRLWCEHGGGEHVQGDPVGPYEPGDTNPDHCFEIHPVTGFGDSDTLASLGPIVGYEYKDAEQSFHEFEGAWSHITVEGSKVRIVSRPIGFNYVAFKIRPLADKPGRVSRIEREDGLTVRSEIKDLQGERLVTDRRMFFVKGTDAEQKVRDLPQGECMQVLGMPRINLELVNWRISAEGRARGALDWGLPYEMVILGVLDDSTECEVE
jgi:hypothetical protein